MTAKKLCKTLTLRQGKVLRYIVDRGELSPTSPKQTINSIAWSDLPHSFFQAKKCCNELVDLGLIKQVGRRYIPTIFGQEVTRYANKSNFWMKPPSPQVMNKRNN